MFQRKIGIDCNITLEESSIYVSTSITIVSRFILRYMFDLPNFSHLPVLSFHLFVASTAISKIGQSPIFSYSNRRSLIRLHSPISEASKILLLDHFWLPFQVPLRCSHGSSSTLDGCQWRFLKSLLSTSSSSNFYQLKFS